MEKKVMVFGVFDGLHEGHIFFLNEARKIGQRLFVVVATDDYVKRFKGKTTRFNQEERVEKIKSIFPDFEVLSSDKEEYSWNVIRENQPDVIALGYDQIQLAEAIKKDMVTFDKKPEIIIISDFDGNKVHSSFL
jgi:FAD synthetase